jgi:UDP-2-acetamido-3-amino-2,3-dideoxy-glucuronate N-acetyltransferase
MSYPAKIHPTATVEPGVIIGSGTSVWDNVHIRRGARIGEQCVIGERTRIDYGVQIGSHVNINASVYICSGVTVEDGATIGANATIESGIEIGRYAMIGMGSVVSRSIPDHHLAYGNPARSIGVVCRCTALLALAEIFDDESLTRIRCAVCSEEYTLVAQTMWSCGEE